MHMCGRHAAESLTADGIRKWPSVNRYYLSRPLNHGPSVSTNLQYLVVSQGAATVEASTIPRQTQPAIHACLLSETIFERQEDPGRLTATIPRIQSRRTLPCRAARYSLPCRRTQKTLAQPPHPSHAKSLDRMRVNYMWRTRQVRPGDNKRRSIDDTTLSRARPNTTTR